MGGFCLLVELHREGSVPAACAAGLFYSAILYTFRRVKLLMSDHYHIEANIAETSLQLRSICETLNTRPKKLSISKTLNDLK